MAGCSRRRVAVLFFLTARDEAALTDISAKPDVTVNVVAKQWNWDFNYIESGAYESSTMVAMTGKPGVAATLPALYLPVNKRVEFVLTSRDVIHSFWVPQFLEKLDVVPGKANRFQVAPTELGTFQGKCAEQCGAYHSAMLFQALISAAEGECGFFSPHSWWPLAVAASAAILFLGLAVGWWLVIIGMFLAALAVIGWTYEYFRGVRAV